MGNRPKGSRGDGPTITAPTGNERSAIFRAGIAWSEQEPWNTRECRKYFLLGMTDQSPFLVRGKTNIETFWPSETQAEAIYGTVAKLYARDLGVKDPNRDAAASKRVVLQSLQPLLNQGRLLEATDGKQLIAYLAGLHARHGTSDGFQFSGTGLAFAVGQTIARHGVDDVKVEASPGFPGGSTITLSGRNGARAELLTLLEWVEVGVQKEAGPQGGGRLRSTPVRPAGETSRSPDSLTGLP
jgi:hypothetical protein